MRYLRSVFTRLFTRVVGRVVVGYLADPGCLDDASTHPKGQGMSSGRGLGMKLLPILRTNIQPLIADAFFQPRRSIYAQ